MPPRFALAVASLVLAVAAWAAGPGRTDPGASAKGADAAAPAALAATLPAAPAAAAATLPAAPAATPVVPGPAIPSPALSDPTVVPGPAHTSPALSDPRSPPGPGPIAVPGGAPAPAAGLSAPAPADASAGAFEVIDFDWHDALRDRAVPVRLYWPAKAADARVPLIVFSHGIGGSRAGYSYLGRFWAGQGMASLHVQHVGSDRALWSGNVFSLISRLHNAAQETEAVNRVADLRHALDLILASERGAQIDRARIVAAGHSYGANTAMLVAGARVERHGRALELRDPRVTAAILISAPPFYGESDLGAILGSVLIPTLHVTCTEDVISVPGYHSPPGDRLKVFEAIGGRLKVLAMFEGGSHSIFTDRWRSGGLGSQVKAATQSLSLAFLRRAFDGAEESLAAWNAAQGALVARFITR